ncbi:MAG: alpha/beta fold hydrolase [Patescibacteria group bacterium]
MTKMNKIIIIIFLALALFGREAVAGETIVLVGGWSRTGTPQEIAAQLDPMESALREAGHRVVVVRPTIFLPLPAAAEELYVELEKEGVLKEEIALVGWCWGGLIARRFAEQYHGEARVRAIVEIASPNGGYRFAPRFLFDPGIERSVEVPLFVIAGNKSAEKWYLRPENDGTVDIQSVLSVSARGTAVFPLRHLELIASGEVARQVAAWLK